MRTERVPYQRYLLHELAADIHSGHNVRSTVFIEARAMYRADGPEEMRPVGEVEFVQGLAAASASGLYGPGRAAAAIVGHANLLLGDRVEPVLQALQAASPNRFRGIRHSVTWDPHPEVENTAAHNQEGQLANNDFRAGARVLARMGFSLEGWMFFPQLPELADFARAVPDLTIILNHIGGLLRVGPYANRDDEVLATWRSGIAAVAACPNVVIKLGGIGMPRTGFDWHTREKPIGSEDLAESMAPFMTYCIEQFGPNRCMFESNFPVDKVSYSYNVMYNAFKRLSAHYTAAERAAMFHDTAARVYRIDI
jgi:predicted TIM-barrel fold metal-dependent hydrolase